MGELLGIGKIPGDKLEKMVFRKLSSRRREVLLRPRIGEDCAAVDLGGDICVLSSDPITGTSSEVGRLAVHVTCNDIAANGAEPVALMLTVLVPVNTDESDLESLMEQANSAASQLGVEIVGGHTEVTSAVTRMTVVSTGLGRTIRSRLVTSSGAKAGDDIVLTKWAGLEGTVIMAHDRGEELKKEFGEEAVERAKSLMDHISVVKEGIIACRFGASAMHDVTEGGVLGALWEMAEASGKGFEVQKELIPVLEETEKFARYFGIDPLKLISSGCMLIAGSEGSRLVRLLSENGIQCALIGKFTEDQKRWLLSEGERIEVGQPGADELYKILPRA